MERPARIRSRISVEESWINGVCTSCSCCVKGVARVRESVTREPATMVHNSRMASGLCQVDSWETLSAPMIRNNLSPARSAPIAVRVSTVYDLPEPWQPH